MRPTALVAVSLVFALPFPADGAAQRAPLWGGLKPGRHLVGFRHWPGERGGWLALWYPATHDSAAALRFGEYGERVAAGGSATPVRHLATGARRDARAARGSFPVVLYVPDGDGADNTVLAEYLASHGYVVASAAGGAAGVDAALAAIGGYSFADPRAVALIGYGRGAEVALSQAARLPAVRALVALDPPASFDARTLAAGRALLTLRASERGGARSGAGAGEGALAITIPRSTHGSFGDAAAMHDAAGGDDDLVPDHRGIIGAVIHAFLDGVLRSWGPSVTELGSQLERAGLSVER